MVRAIPALMLMALVIGVVPIGGAQPKGVRWTKAELWTALLSYPRIDYVVVRNPGTSWATAEEHHFRVLGPGRGGGVVGAEPMGSPRLVNGKRAWLRFIVLANVEDVRTFERYRVYFCLHSYSKVRTTYPFSKFTVDALGTPGNRVIGDDAYRVCDYP